MPRILITLLTLSGAITAQEIISTESPFVGLGAASASSEGGNAPSGPLEFCGTLTVGDRVLYGLYDTTTQKGRWLSLNEESNGWLITNFNPERRQITLQIQGQTQVLTLRQPRFDGSAAAAPVPIAQAANNGPQGPAVTPADEATRLKAVAEEIKRRRMLRQKQQQPQPGQPQPAPGAQ